MVLIIFLLIFIHIGSSLKAGNRLSDNLRDIRKNAEGTSYAKEAAIITTDELARIKKAVNNRNSINDPNPEEDARVKKEIEMMQAAAKIRKKKMK